MEESLGLQTFRSDHRVSARAVAESVREASRALYSSKKGSYQRSVESKVNEFTKHCCCWLYCGSLRIKGVARSREAATLVHAERNMHGNSR